MVMSASLAMTISSAARGAGCPPDTPHLQLNGRETPKFPSPIQRTFQEEATQISFFTSLFHASADDAAFVARPHTAMGVSKAAGDVMALSNCLSREGDLSTALQRYEADRIVAGREVVAYGRQLGASAL
jgi:hypothetical protein